MALSQLETAGSSGVRPGKMLAEIIPVEQPALAAASDDLVETLEEAGRNRLAAAGDHRHGAGRDAAPFGDAAQAAVGEAPGQCAQQRLVDRRYLPGDGVERRAVELQHHEVARRHDGGVARRAGKEPGLADRFADADFVDRVALAFDQDLEATRHHDVDRIRRRALPDQNRPARQVVHLGARPDGVELLVRELAEDRSRAKQLRRIQSCRFLCHALMPRSKIGFHLCRPYGGRQSQPPHVPIPGGLSSHITSGVTSVTADAGRLT